MNKICLLLIALSLSGLVWAQEAPRYEVYAVQYGTIPDLPVAELVQAADKQRKLDIAMIVWLVRGGGRTILVDSGFYRPQFFKEWTVKDYVRPDEAVAKLGVKTEHGTVVLASDNVYLYENLDKHVPIAATLDAESNLRAQDRMRTIASRPEFVVPGHDPAEFGRFKAVTPGVVRVD